MKKGLTIGIIFLFLSSSVVPISIGHDIEVEITSSENSRNIAYAFVYPGYNMVSFDLASPGTFTILGPYTGSGSVGGGTWAKGNWYVTDYYSPALMYYDLDTKTLVTIGGSGTTYNDISYDVTTGTMYGASSYNLYKIDIRTGAQTLVGSWGSNYLMIDIAINNAGIIYGHDIVTDSIYIINKDTGAATFLCPSSCAGNMEYDHDNNILYAYGNGTLYTYNLTNGDCTLVGYFPGNAEIEGLAIPYTCPPSSPPYADFTWTPLGPYINETVFFDASASFDPDGDITSYDWDWDNDGYYEEYSTSPIISHSWSNAGEFPITLRVCDNCDGYTTKTHTITIFINYPPETPEINGPTKGKTGEKYTYCISPIIDPDEDCINVFWDWGDGTNSSWLGAYPSGQEICESHSWKTKDTYIIKAKLKDEHGAESGWGTLEVTIPRNRALYNSIWLSLADRFPILEKLLNRLGQ